MTEAELIVADLVIMNMPYKQGISILGYIRALIGSGKFQFAEDIRLKVYEVNESAVRTFLLEQGYTEPVNHSIPSDMLIEKGLKARQLGGHKQYLAWETENERLKRIEDFPKKKWYLYEPLRLAAAVIITAIVTIPISYLLGKKDATKNVLPASPKSTQVYRPKDTARSLPKTSSKKDSLLR